MLLHDAEMTMAELIQVVAEEYRSLDDTIRDVCAADASQCLIYHVKLRQSIFSSSDTESMTMPFMTQYNNHN